LSPAGFQRDIGMAKHAIIVRRISKTFGTVRAVDGLDFDVPAATCFGFLGPNGAGKTTLMKMLYGMCRPDADDEGTMDVFGYDPRREELAIKHLAGVVPQENNLDEELNVVGNLMVFARFYNLPRAVARERIAELLAFLELADKAKAKIKELSGGMKRRLVVARALLNAPRLLILDEPTTGLDPQVRHVIWDKLRQLKRRGTTILLTTHYMDEAFQICDKLLIMDRGRAVLDGRPRDLLTEHIEPYVLEVFDGQGPVAVDARFGGALRVETSSEITRVYGHDVEQLRGVAVALHSDHYHVREANLEDLFLKTTGRSLNAIQ
jgi:lipooligosaccharide transport system ATP-binding protein